jgi:hypothetical protein
MIRIAVLVGLLLCATSPESAPASSGESAAETATACLRHVQRLAFVAPELICLHSTPKAAVRLKSVV